MGIVQGVEQGRSGKDGTTVREADVTVFYDGSCPVLEQLEHALHPWVAFLVLPMFAFANAGISFRGISVASIFEPVTLGIAGGLIIGKQIGVFVPLSLVIRLGIARMPKNANYLQLYAVFIRLHVRVELAVAGGASADREARFDDCRA